MTKRMLPGWTLTSAVWLAVGALVGADFVAELEDRLGRLLRRRKPGPKGPRKAATGK